MNQEKQYVDYFEPDRPIFEARDFTDELIKYCQRNHKDLIILKESMTPIVRIDGKRYECVVESPRLKVGSRMIPTGRRILGYQLKFVYIYEY